MKDGRLTLEFGGVLFAYTFKKKKIIMTGTWREYQGDPSSRVTWDWRRCAVFKKRDWPAWGEKALIQMAASIDIVNRCCAVGFQVRN